MTTPGGSVETVTVVRPSLVLFRHRTELRLSGYRVMVREPVTILGLLPLRSVDVGYPLDTVSGAGAITRISIPRAVVGAVALAVGLVLMGDSAVLGIALVVLGVVMLANAPCAVFFLVDDGGGISPVTVSPLDRREIRTFADRVNHRRFADDDHRRDG